MVTNAHVVDGARELHVTFMDGTDVPAELLVAMTLSTWPC